MQDEYEYENENFSNRKLGMLERLNIQFSESGEHFKSELLTPACHNHPGFVWTPKKVVFKHKTFPSNQIRIFQIWDSCFDLRRFFAFETIVIQNILHSPIQYFICYFEL